MSDSEIKVTDRRMFTPDGRLREGFEHLEAEKSPPPSRETTGPQEGKAPEAKEARSAGEPAASRPEAEAAAPERPAPGPRQEGESGARLEIPGTPPGLGAPTFFDLVSVLAEPVLVFLGDARMPDGSTNENLDMARLYIDLLDLLRQKTAGRLTSDEATFLEDLLYQLRMRYVQKSD